ncbi:MAG TPA: hypothetical protein DEB25_05845, partial [Desulfobulbaceae bacterium]|nr:hypothetical protein [Desulfobulbaceae bacterium]
MSIADDTGQDKFLFDEPARAALRQEILAAITGDVPFIVLTGPSGAGKTTLISRLTARLPGNIKDIFISQATGDDRRFEDVLLRVCQRIAPEISWDSHPNAQEVQRIQEQIRNYLIEKNIRILLIIDQAEQAFLAMLERVRKMLDTVNDGAVRMQLLLVGKEILLTNIEPLCLVQFEDIDERYFTLPLLTEDSPAQSGQPAARKILTAFSAAKLGRRLKNALPAPPRLPTFPRKHPAKQEPL